jgi:hypothetical protein
MNSALEAYFSSFFYLFSYMKIQKTIASALALSLTVGVAQAQTEAGKLLVSGQVNYFQSEGESTSTTNATGSLHQDYKQSSFNFAPQIGYFIADNLALGISVGLGSGRFRNTRTDANNLGTYRRNDYTKGINVGPFVRYYKMLGERAGFFGQLVGGYQRQNQDNSTDYSGVNGNEYYDYRAKVTGGFATLSPGFIFFPTPKIGLELTVGGISYTKSKSTTQSQSNQYYLDNYEGSSSSFGANFGLQHLAVGASFHLGN